MISENTVSVVAYRSSLPQHVVEASNTNIFKTRLDNFGLIRIANICGKPTYPGPEVDQKYYVIIVITTMKLITLCPKKTVVPNFGDNFVKS